MDKRKLKLKTSLHKNLQDSQSSQLEKLESVSDKRQSLATSLSATSTVSLTMERKNDSFIDEKLSNIRSSVLKPLNSQSIVGNSSSMKSRKRNFCEIKNDTSEEEEEEEEEEDWITNRKLSRTIVSRSRQNSQVSINTSVISPENTYSPGNSKSPIKRHYLKRSRIVGSRITKEVSKEAEKSESNSLFNESTIIKKKCETVQNVNTNDDPLRKDSIIYKSPAKSISKSNISQKKQHDKSRELYSSTISEKHEDNKEDHLPRWQNVPLVFSNFLQKCGIILSTNDIHILSKYFYVLCFIQKEYIYEDFLIKFRLCIFKSLYLDVPSSVAKRKMKKLLKQYQKKDIIDAIDKYIRNEERFEKMLNEMELSVDIRGFSALNNISLARILLELTEIQADVYNIFISKLNEFVLLA